MIELACEARELRPRLAVVGIGGAGGNAVAGMARSGLRGVELVAANTDAQALRGSPAERILQLGRRATQGLGAGSRPDLGRSAAEESLPEIERMLEGMHMCFLAAGLGGGTGTGAAPVIGRAARERGILTVGVVTTPFSFEGRRRAAIAAAGLEALRPHVDTLIVVPNQNLFRIAGAEMTFRDAFAMADAVLREGVRGITDLVVMPGLVNLDFADLRTVMADMGPAMMGAGEASGAARAMRAAEAAIANPLLDDSVQGAGGLLVSITGGEDLKLMEVDEAAEHIRAQVDPEAQIIWGSAFDPDLEGRIRVSVIATGLGGLDVSAAATAGEPEPEAEPEPVPAKPLAPPPPPPPPILVLEPPSEPAEERELLLTAEWTAPPAGPGPSLFDRMAGAARAAVVRRGSEMLMVAAE